MKKGYKDYFNISTLIEHFQHQIKQHSTFKCFLEWV